jgi:hypothetical protein
MKPTSTEKLSVYNWMKCQTLPGGTEPLFVRVEPPLENGDLELVSAAKNRVAIQKWIPTALQQIGQRAEEKSFALIFRDPEKVRKTMNSKDGLNQPPAKTRAFKAPGRSGKASPVLKLYQDLVKTQALSHPGATTKSTGKKKSTTRGKPRGAPQDKIAFHLVAAVPKEASSSGEPSSGVPSVSDAPLNAPKKRTKKRRQRKKKKEPESVNPSSPSASPQPQASIPVAPIPVVSSVAEEVMDVGEDDDATTTSVQSTRSYASVIVTQDSPTEVTTETEQPSPVTASGESSKHQSEIANLESKVAELQAQLATQARDPPEVRTTAESAISDPSSLTACTPDADLDGAVVLFPPRILYGTQAMAHMPPSYDLPPPPKRSRHSELSDTQSAPLTGLTEEDSDALVNNAASQVSNLTLDNIPRSSSSEPGMPL